MAFRAVMTAKFHFLSFDAAFYAALKYFAAARANREVRFNRQFNQSAKAVQVFFHELLSKGGQFKTGFFPFTRPAGFHQTVFFQGGQKRVHLSRGNFFFQALSDFLHQFIAMVPFFGKQQHRVKLHEVRYFGFLHTHAIPAKVFKS